MNSSPQVVTTPPGGPAPVRPLQSRTVPATLRLLIAVLVVACLTWGAVAAWTVGQHAAAAQSAVSVSEPLSLTAQRMYQALSDADVTATTAFLGGPQEPLAARQRYEADVAQAAAELAALKSASAGGNQPLGTALAAVSSGLPAYTAYVAQAQTYAAAGYGLTGGSFMQVASEEMHQTLLPAARQIYDQENARLAADSGTATGLPPIAITLGLAVILLIALYRTQRWLLRRTNRLVNPGLTAATAVLLIGVIWLASAFALARTDLRRAEAQGSAPAGLLAQASIAVQRARGDEVLNLISRSGATSFVQDYQAVRAKLGPGTGTLLGDASAMTQGGPAGPAVAAAVREAPAWYTANDQVYKLDLAASYAAETQLVIGTGPDSSAAGFSRLEQDLGQAISAEQDSFASAATAGANAFAGLQIGLAVAALLMAVACAVGLNRRLAEYR